jgi:integrase
MASAAYKGVNLVPETKASPLSRSECEAMARRRHQNPKPKRHGNQWRVLLWKDVFENGSWTRKKVPEVLGRVDEIGFREAQKRADRVVEPLNLQPRNPGIAITYAEFVKDVYEVVYLPAQSKSHADRYRGILGKRLVPALGKVSLFELEKPQSTIAQQYFNALKAEQLAAQSLDKIRDCFSSTMAVALEKEYITHNPALGINLPKGRPTPRLKPTITVQQFDALVEIIAEPYATMIYTAIYTGLRASEIIALPWRNLHRNAITIDVKYCRGERGEPKSDASNATIRVPAKVIERIHRLKGLSVTIGGGRWGKQTYKLVKRSEPDDLVFQSVRKGVEMRDNNILTRHIAPAARKLGLRGVNWQCLRRSHATWLKRAGVPLKDASTQMRHSRTDITADIYEMTDYLDQIETVSKLDAYTGSTMVN